ncbi:AAR049Cp [Eremothecium gossypii ATCC 10895]|uniref:Postreplication repair E3 ubiquitin-protein ligase RAD18 n=1 Tax=Eremothecium gossypii (strain ATCC 10895 / CBS 109.51 / FGSC 9923 / NRRL Y-1056) TaxID=284811 RepID=RAD18_EREGS|nr:AAR049Cp [Eremothecium gossypii ATCC 10895]Q75EN0.1 RecName: Full=Postreplication repair E3 ubiquitin-protein ligase RAD18; AltName: Full=RING-type E3 ubiquitin transferase RAD18 [Eremothecium gossypii ATCC 10895]AAS50414.1 AAR049Cp [Eremothecium gossypii ATCC 10895]AEY94700.1 FAAR049Cp [Eremothecium gossypii FDAG1]
MSIQPGQVVTDPSDFAGTTIPELADLDSLLRCHICKDMLQTPVLTQCGHTFCSLCIREYLNKESRCPLCLAELRQNMLQKEFLVGELAACYMELRARLLETVRIPPKKVAEVVQNNSPIELDSDGEVEIIESCTGAVPGSKRGSPQVEEVEAAAKRQRTKQNGIQYMLQKKPKAVGEKVPCPICNRLYNKEFLERVHLDECLMMGTLRESGESDITVIEQQSYTAEPDSKNSHVAERRGESPVDEVVTHKESYLGSGLRVTKSRLPKLHFTSLSTSQLKQKLSELGLPTAGSRQQMINRYNHYELLWNSNFLDSIQPVGEGELRRSLLSWEATRNTDTPISSGVSSSITNMLKTNNSASTLLKSFKTDKFDKSAWSRLHGKEFRRLIRAAKKSMLEQDRGEAITAQNNELSTKASVDMESTSFRNDTNDTIDTVTDEVHEDLK